MNTERSTVPASESFEEEALLCVKHQLLTLSQAREAVAKFRETHGFSWISEAYENAQQPQKKDAA